MGSGYANCDEILESTPFYEVPLLNATSESIAGYGRLVENYDSEVVIIEPWVAVGRRKLCNGTGIGGGFVEGLFRFQWKDDNRCYAQNDSVGGDYTTGVTYDNRSSVLVREANYHPDGGQVVFPTQAGDYVMLVAKCPSDGRSIDDVTPQDFVAFYFDQPNIGFQIFANVWHQPVYPINDTAVFLNKQGAVHACFEVDFIKEFDCVLKVPLRKET